MRIIPSEELSLPLLYELVLVKIQEQFHLYRQGYSRGASGSLLLKANTAITLLERSTFFKIREQNFVTETVSCLELAAVFILILSYF